nr:hypothetical protein [Planctomycetota bacterium]
MIRALLAMALLAPICAPAVERPDEQAIAAALVPLAAIFAQGPTIPVAAQWDMQRLTEVVNGGGLGGRDTRIDRATLASLLAATRVNGWEHARLLTCAGTDRADEAVALVRCGDADGARMVRLWLRRDGATWRPYDLEILPLPLRLSALLAIGVADGPRNDPNQLSAACRLALCVLNAIANPRGDNLNDILRLDATALPHALMPAFDVTHATWLLGCGNHQAALAALDGLVDMEAAYPSLSMLRAHALLACGRHADALAAAASFEALVGSDVQSSLLRGSALQALGRCDEAAAAYRAVLAARPGLNDAIAGLFDALPEGRKGEIAAVLRAAPQPEHAFSCLANGLLNEERTDELDDVLTAYATIDADEPELVFFRAFRLAAVDLPGEAADAIRGAWNQAGDEDRRSTYIGLFLEWMAAAGRSGEAYAAFGDADRDAVFSTLADSALAESDVPLLSSLCAAHAHARPGAKDLPLYAGEIARLNGDADRADVAFRRGVALEPSDELAERYRAARVINLHAAGRLAEAAAVAPLEASFRQLAVLIAGRDADLATLVGARLAAAPENPAARLWEAVLRFRAGAYAETADLFAMRSALFCEDEGLAGRYFDTRVRTLVRLGRHAEALDLAMAGGETLDDPRFELVVHAARGERAAAQEAWE